MAMDRPAERRTARPSWARTTRARWRRPRAATACRFSRRCCTPFLTFAAEAAEEHKNHTLFYICGGGLALWAVLVSFIGMRGHENWPGNESTARGVMGISALLVVLAMASAVITA